MKAIIPTGGRGTRMQPLTFSTNKHFIPVANKPLIYYPIESVAEAGIKDIAITYNPGWLDIVKSYGGRVAICGDPKSHSTEKIIKKERLPVLLMQEN